MKAHGTFEVKVTPVASDPAQGGALGRMTLDKRFEGDLVGISKGEMLTATTAVKGSAGYVAIESFEGTLQGRDGAFVLQHLGTMDRGEQRLLITIVPDSGTAALIGISGTMSITITQGKHFYDLDYTLEPARSAPHLA